MKYTLLKLLLLTTTLAFAQQTGTISGNITDKAYNLEPLPFVNVYIEGTNQGTTSNMNGVYQLTNLSPGNYTVVYSFLGYETQQIPVLVKSGETTKVTIEMAPSASVLEEVLISSSNKRESEVALLLQQKNALVMKQHIGANELARKGVSTAAGAVTKISGISKQEGSSAVYVRGLGDRYLNTTLNGLPLPSNNVDEKNIDLSLFSSNIIKNISVSKAYAVGFYGDFSAGNININSKDFKGTSLLNVGVSSGFNTNAVTKNFVKSEGTGHFGYYNRYRHNPFAVVLSHGIDPVSAGTPINTNYSLTAGKSFQFKNQSRLHIFATASFKNAFQYRQGTTRDYTLVEKKAFQNSAEAYEYTTTTTGLATANYKITPNNTLTYNGIFINSTADVVGYFGINGNGKNRDAIRNTDAGFYQMNAQFDQTKMLVNQLLGQHIFQKFKVNWGFGYNYVRAHQPDRKRISLENYQLALDDNPNTNPTFYNNVDFDNQRYFQNITDTAYNGQINLAYQANEQTTIHMGFNGKQKVRDFNNIRYGYAISDINYPVTDVHNLNSIFTLNNLHISENDGGIYQIKVIKPIPGFGTTNMPGLPENTYQGTNSVFAAYAHAEILVGSKWLFIPGIRAESIKQDIDFHVINLGLQGQGLVSSENKLLLPSLQVKYGISDNQNLRFSASKTASLPEFKEVAPFVYEDISVRVGGNPDLLNKGYSKIYNLDLHYEWFFGKGELLSVAAFAKTIKDPINLVVSADATGTQRYFRTGKKASVYGIELEFRKNILTNNNANKILSTGFNASYMHTKQDLDTKIDGNYYDVSFNKTSDALQGASPLLLNADISYSPQFKNYKPTANLVFSYFADRIDALGSGQLGNVIEKGVPTLNVIWKNTIKNNLDITISVLNILNPRIQYYRETTLGNVLVNSANGKGITDYKRGLELGLDLNYRF
ncbi:TonB-dependent receptor domain-containing protein [Bizionia sediminis]|uniref:TonB-dependent receptor domain-containing protein n=1 Tax=Bizionia sediminis TaxID=1737064 RepID=A0ABW5KTK9_9FLAO